MRNKRMNILYGLAAAVFFSFFAIGDKAAAGDLGQPAEETDIFTEPSETDVYTKSNLYSYLFCGDGSYTTVDRYSDKVFHMDTGKSETTDDHTVVTKYDSDMATVLSRRELDEELPKWGGVCASQDGEYYFVVTGQNNTKESADVECVRITKYDKNWSRLGSVGLSDCNTTKPFFYGNCRMAMNGDLMLVHTSHEMYKSKDGYNHQANMSIWVDTANMKIISHQSKVSNVDDSYVSHSFYQFVSFDKDGHIVMVNHGDAYPRAAIIHVSKNAVSGTDGSKLPQYGEWYHADAMTFQGDTGVNETKAVTGGLAVGDGRYLIAISSVRQDADWKSHKTKSIYVVSANSDLTDVKNYDKPLVEYPEGEETAGTPVIVRAGADSFLVMWERGEQLYSVLVDENGNRIGEIAESEGSLDSEYFTKLGCQPVLCGDKIVWYTLTGDGSISWNSIDPADLGGGVDRKETVVPDEEIREDMAAISLDANGGTVNPAVVERIPGEKMGGLPLPVFSGHSFEGWFTAKDGGEKVTADTVVNSMEPFTLYARWKDGETGADSPWGTVLPEDRAGYSSPDALPAGLWAAGIEEKGYDYTGYAIMPEPRVYIGNTRLYEDSDYTVKYKSNTKVGDNKASVTITAKDAQYGKLKKKFTILPVKMDSPDVTTYDMADLYIGSLQKPAPYIFWKGKALKKNTDYTVSYIGGFTEPGNYTIRVTGKGRFTGTRDISYSIVTEGGALPMNCVTAKMKKKPSTPCNEETARSRLTVSINGVTLTKGYDVKWENIGGSGSASAILIGNGEVCDDGVTRFTGTKRVKFKIKYVWKMSKFMVSSIGPQEYTGFRVMPKVTVVNGNSTVNATLVEGRDYVLTYKKNVSAGTATAVIKGINGYLGTVKMKFTIKAAD